jgi:NAD(P)H dehydrogenase (quinone)
MFVVTGITGNVGGEVARRLLAAHLPVRGIVRDVRKGATWAAHGCELCAADINDAAALSNAFRGADGVFILVPPNFDPSPDFREANATAAALSSALEAARPQKVAYLSTIGAQASRSNLLSQHTIIEQALQKLPVPITFLRPAWFMENSAWEVAPAKNGVIPCFLQPLDKPFPMVATSDVGRVAGELLQEPSHGHSLVELEGPHRISPNEIAATFATLLGHPVKAEAVPRETWESLFKSQGMKNPTPRIQMLDGFNEGWIEFEHGEASSRKGNVGIETVLRKLIERESASAS